MKTFVSLESDITFCVLITVRYVLQWQLVDVPFCFTKCAKKKQANMKQCPISIFYELTMRKIKKHRLETSIGKLLNDNLENEISPFLSMAYSIFYSCVSHVF